MTLNGPMEGKARFSGLPGGTALQGGEVGHYNYVMYNAIKGTDLSAVQDTYTYCHTDSYVHHTHLLQQVHSTLLPSQLCWRQCRSSCHYHSSAQWGW